METQSHYQSEYVEKPVAPIYLRSAKDVTKVASYDAPFHSRVESLDRLLSIQRSNRGSQGGSGIADDVTVALQTVAVVAGTAVR